MEFGEHIIPLNTIIYKTDLTFVFLNHKPIRRFHILISPIRKIKFYHEMTAEEMKDMHIIVQKMMKIFKIFCDGFFIFLQDGKSAGQTVRHVHMHIVPRHENDDLEYEYSSSKRKQMDLKENINDANILKNIIKNFNQIIK
ncbi:HIT family Bis(5'-adenosyl)-triphosphatase [Spraguea lophii 42_110]|uniref:HIT family Bis(5'-adenosyl)-triphosphatase n=1 Tax=Spraguea lophii (strain 42_110) TaxID=1358809 RepID=S7XRE8_SPRLO|nr:HIT family Bis(5'-adenosyl)-triphosphatase [Spraguea lophii 42_110]